VELICLDLLILFYKHTTRTQFIHSPFNFIVCRFLPVYDRVAMNMSVQVSWWKFLLGSYLGGELLGQGLCSASQDTAALISQSTEAFAADIGYSVRRNSISLCPLNGQLHVLKIQMIWLATFFTYVSKFHILWVCLNLYIDQLFSSSTKT